MSQMSSISTAGNNAWVVVLDQEPLKTAANKFQNILHLFIAKRADHEVCGGDTTLRKTTIGGRAKQ